MEFLNPIVLWGLLGVSIPIAIHLLQLKRYKTVYFSDIRFLKQVQQSTRKRSQIKHWLILLLRILGWSALCIAFALPYFPNRQSGGISTETLLIYVDNSPSMKLNSSEGPLWSRAKSAGISLVERFPQSKFHIITSELNGSDAIALNSSGALKLLNEIKPVEHTLSWKQLAERISTYGLRDSVSLFLFTDGQLSDVTSFNNQGLSVQWIPMLLESTAPANNLSIDSAWLEQPVVLPGEKVELHYSLSSFNEDVSTASVELWVNGDLRGVESTEIPNMSTVNGNLSFSAPTSPLIQIELRISDESIHFDDTYFLTVHTRDKLRFLDIWSKSSETLPIRKYINDSTSVVETVNYTSIPYAELNKFDLILLEPTDHWPTGLVSALVSAIEDGTSILLFPEGPTDVELSDLGVASYLDLDTFKVDDIAISEDDPFFKGVFYESTKKVLLPALNHYYPIHQSYTSKGGLSLLASSDDSPSLLRYSKGEGQIYQWNAHPNQHSGSSELYPVLVYQMAIFKERAPAQSQFLEATTSLRYKLPANAQDVVKIEQDSLVVIPEQSRSGKEVNLIPQSKGIHTGFAVLKQDNETVDILAFNANRKESNLKRASTDQIEETLKESNVAYQWFQTSDAAEINYHLDRLNEVHSSHRTFIFIAILVLLAEMILWSRPKA